MSRAARLDKLMPGLSAKERAILILESWKAGEKEDPAWRSTMPSYQMQEFNQLIQLMNGSVILVGNYITVLDLLVDRLELRQCWLVALILWDEHVSMIERAVRLGVREPITQMAFDKEKQVLEETWVPVAELAETWAGETEWQPADLEQGEDDEPDVSDEAWDREVGLKERELRRLVRSGALKGRGRGAALQVQEGAFNRIAGQTITPAPDTVLQYRVLPDEEAAAVDAERYRLQRLYALLGWPHGDEEAEEPLRVGMANSLRQSMSESFADLWNAVVAVDRVLAETAQRFGGADPIRPSKRELLEQTRGRLESYRQQWPLLDVDVELPEPDQELIAAVRGMVRENDRASAL